MSNRILKLNSSTRRAAQGYSLNANQKYIVNLYAEDAEQQQLQQFMRCNGYPKAIDDYNQWVMMNGFQGGQVSQILLGLYFGVEPLWQTRYSQGIVVEYGNNNYAIVIECSKNNGVYAHKQILIAG